MVFITTGVWTNLKKSDNSVLFLDAESSHARIFEILITRCHETNCIKRKLWNVKKTHENKKNRKNVAVMLYRSPQSNHIDVEKTQDRKKKKNTRKHKKNRKDVAVMLCCSPWSNHADVKKHSTQNKQKNTRKQKQKQKICCSNALALTLVQPCRCPILFLSCSQSQCCLSAGEKVSFFVGQ